MKGVRVCLSRRRPSLFKQCTTTRSQHLRCASQSAYDGDFAGSFRKSIEDTVNNVADTRQEPGIRPRRVVTRLEPLPPRDHYNPLAEDRPQVSWLPQEPASNSQQESPVQERFIVRPTLERFPDAELAHRTGFVSSAKDFATVKEALPILVGHGPWQLSKNNPRRLYRSFRFKSFKTTWEFMNIVAAECTTQKHHPEWANIYNRVRINWVTHDPPGLSSKDIYMAKFCDEKAKELGEERHEVNLYVLSRLGNLTDNEMHERQKVMHHLKGQLRNKNIDVNLLKSLLERLEKLG